MSAYWMPFTDNRGFAAAPRTLARAEGVYYWTEDNRRILDGTSGIWCVNLGHARPEIGTAIAEQFARLDFAPSFELCHPTADRFCDALVDLAPAFSKVFLTSSGSEAIDSALKMALAYHHARGEAQRTVIVGRERGYHGSTIGGISVGGHGTHRAVYRSALMPAVMHMPHTLDIARCAFSRGQPAHGAELADELERRLLALHDPRSVAAVIVEPIAGTTGVLLPPVGYLQRLRDICTRYGILLIFDEVMTGFGRLGTAFAYQYFGVVPDLLVFAKACTNAVVPCGGVMCPIAIFDAITQASPKGSIEFAHGFTYSGHPLACAAGIATLKTYQDGAVFKNVQALAPHFENALHSLRGLPFVRDIRNLGFVGAIELDPRPGSPRARGREAHLHAFANGVLIRFVGDTIAIAPPLVATADDLAAMVDAARTAIVSLA
jgi:beta-alanine--pyruvate transaminase